MVPVPPNGASPKEPVPVSSLENVPVPLSGSQRVPVPVSGPGSAVATEPVPAASPEIAAQIRAALPTYGEVDKPASPPPVQEAAAEPQMPHPIPRLHGINGDRQFRPPNGLEVLTDKGRQELAMDTYLGKKDGLDRGLLNRWTLPELWAKIPVLKYLPLPIPAITNEERALDLELDEQSAGAVRDELEFGGLDRVELNAQTTGQR